LQAPPDHRSALARLQSDFPELLAVIEVCRRQCRAPRLTYLEFDGVIVRDESSDPPRQTR